MSVQPVRQSTNPSVKNTPSSNLTRGNTTVTASLYQGAIPPPDMMEHYKEVDPTFPSRILAMAEEEGVHRRKYNDRLLLRSFQSDIVGSSFGLVAVMAIAYLAYCFMINGHSEDGRTIAVAVMVGLAGIFVIRKWNKKENK